LVVVTRPASQAEALAEPLRALGAEVLIVPALEILPPLDRGPLRNAIRNLDQYDWIVVTSVNGALALQRELSAQGKDLGGPRPAVAAVGLATQDAMFRLGAVMQLIPDRYSAEQLALKMAPLVEGKRVLLWQGTSAGSTLAEGLFAAGARVERVDAYRAAEPPALARQLGLLLLERKQIDAVTFTSAQMALNFFRALERNGTELPSGTVIASIGPVTSSALREMGKTVDVEAPAATMQSLAHVLGEHFSEGDSLRK
jgi:uroporphyrinogen-III synthase